MSCLTWFIFSCVYCFFLKQWNYIKIFVLHEQAVLLQNFFSHRLTSSTSQKYNRSIVVLRRTFLWIFGKWYKQYLFGCLFSIKAKRWQVRRFQVWGARFQVSGAQVPDARSQVSGSRCQVPGSMCHTPGIRDQISGIRSLVKMSKTLTLKMFYVLTKITNLFSSQRKLKTYKQIFHHANVFISMFPKNNEKNTATYNVPVLGLGAG